MKYNFEIANFNDAKEIADIESKYFKKGIAYTEEFIKKWMEYNQEMFYVVKDELGAIKGYTILVPITKECYKKLYQGQIKDMLEFKEEDVLQTKRSDYHYTASIAISEDNNKIAFMSLIVGIINFFNEYGHHIITTPITEAGVKITKNLGYKPIEEDGINKNYEIVIGEGPDDPHRKRFQRMLKRVQK